MTNFNNIDYDQIIDYLGENLDTGQKKAFEQWLNESELNQQLFEKIKVHWMNQIPGDTISGSMQWERLLYTIKNRQKPNFRKMAIAISVAASILILVSLSWFINISRNNMVSFSTKADSFRKDTLDDGSIVYLYPSSSIEMEQKKMKITLKGEAYL
jgi:ferric-dicitrate binding protein FerR (iron transport regulator)